MISTPSGYAPYADERHVGCLITVGERSFGPDDVKSIKLQYSASHTSEALPGSELVFDVENTDSVSGFFEGLDTGAEISVSLIVGGVPVSMGSFLYSSIAYKESDLVARVTARDYMESLDDVTATDIGTWSTLSGAVAALLPGVAAEFSGTLGSTAVVRGYDAATTKREALRQLAQAACCSCWYTRDKKLRFASLAAGWQGADTLTGDRLRSWDMLSVDEPVGQVVLTTNILEKYFYFDSNDYLEKDRDLGSATIPASTTGWIFFDKPGEMLYVNGYDATDMTATGWWAQMGITLLESSIYGIKISVPRGLIWADDPWKIYISGIEYGVTPTEYTSGTGSAAKAISNPCVPSSRATAVAAWLETQLGRREKYTADYRCNPAIEIGDTIQIYDKSGSAALATVCGISVEYDGGLKSTLTCVKKSAGKEPGELTISPTSLTLDDTTPTGTITVTRAGDGAISAVSSDTEVATVSVSGTAVTVSSTGKGGTAVITVSVAEGTYNLAPPDAACNVVCGFTSASFADADWSEIIAACQAGTVPDTWEVGDSTTIDLAGVSYQVDIIGKSHDTYADGGKAPLTFQLHDCYGTPARYDAMYTSPNEALWETCDARTSTLPDILEAMPAEVQAAIKSVKKVCASSFTAGGSGKYPSSTLTDGLFLLSLNEVTGGDTTIYPVEGSQYAYYKAGNSRIKKLTASGPAVKWWTRTPVSISGSNSYGADYIGTAGATGSDAANARNGIAPAWCF